ncbi:triacylglycerol lipase [Massilia sp. CF038]|uniref:esterase/lipase family protein n=1 Tax=Massilia sp. CF038 TaxID=1881045 RepID=UPI000921775B|nr:permease [Massilia sp. CF038]SHH43755.1 PGAP1-like protein [Massilia sp. CF038]
MPAKPTVGADLLGASRLVLEAVTGVTELVEAVHMNVLDKAIGTPLIRPVSGVTSLVYRSVKGATRLVGGGLDAVLGRLAPALGSPSEWAGREALVAALNGVLGDRLAASGNALAIPMRLRVAGEPSARIVLLAHGLCMNDAQWLRDRHDHGAMLARERGYTPVYLHYNSGRHIADNGRELAAQLQTLVDGWPVPVEEIAIVAHSMGGLVARSSCHAAAESGHGWLQRLRSMVFLGTPHHGAPLERGGNWVHLLTDSSVYSAPFSRLAKIRSAGITDLRHGSVLDAQQDRFAHGVPLPTVLPLPPGVRCLAVAATVGQREGDWKDNLLAGDGLVPVPSALGQHADPARCLPLEPLVLYQTNHMQLLSSRQVSDQLLAWL